MDLSLQKYSFFLTFNKLVDLFSTNYLINNAIVLKINKLKINQKENSVAFLLHKEQPRRNIKPMQHGLTPNEDEHP